MPLRKSRDQREAARAELERQDREHAARLALVNACAMRPPLFCQDCEAKLKPDATGCHYCGSSDLAASQPSRPVFSEASKDGACPRCGGSSFTAPAATGMLAADLLSPSDLVLCVTCGARFRRG